MTKRQRKKVDSQPSEAMIWIDHDEAAILTRGPGESEIVQVLARGLDESVDEFEHRALDEVVDDERVVVTGPAFARTEFERAYVALTKRPERIVDLAPKASPAQPTGSPAMQPKVGAVI